MNITRREAILAGFLGFPWFWHPSERKLAGIRFRVIRRGRSGRRYLLIHGNEETARKVLTAHMEQARGTAHLVENTERNVDIRGGLLDPNRMFSDTGAYENLIKLNPSWTQAQVNQALARLNRKRHEVVDAVIPHHGDVLIALHNNSESYSVTDETGISDAVALNDAANPHEFCLCVSPADFRLLRSGPYNVVLQNMTPQSDDGSLSRLAARMGFRYVNIEAAMGNFDKQQAMLRWVEQTLPAASNREGDVINAKQDLGAGARGRSAVARAAEHYGLGRAAEGPRA